MKTWRSAKIEVSDATLAGRGVIAVDDIAKDDIVAIKAGNIITRAEIEQATDNAGDMALQIDDDFYLAPRSANEIEEMSVFINHSCDPNVGFRGQVVYVALRDIRAGEELCHDYAMERSDDYALDCHCGSPLCRGKVSGEDWKIPELQQRYGDYFSIYIRNKIQRG
jgi:SET domain-containing protein